jgi:hypothetical protein
MTVGIHIADMPDLGAVTDDCSVVGEHAGSGRFAATALRTYLMASSGSGGLLGIPLNIAWFGAHADGSDCTPAFVAALAFLPAGGGHIHIPPGTWAFASQVVYTLQTALSSLTITGAGADLTNLAWAGGGGIRINYIGQYNSTHIRDLSLLTGANGGGAALTMVQTAATIINPANGAQSDISNVTVRGSDGYAVLAHWDTCVLVDGASMINFINCMFIGQAAVGGAGVAIAGTAAVIPVVYNFTGCTFNYLAIGFSYGDWVQGVTFNQCNFTGGAVGIGNTAAATNLDQLAVTGCQFNNTGGGIALGAGVPNTLVSDNLFLVGANAVGFNVTTPGLLVISNNSFQGVGLTNNTGITFIAPCGSKTLIVGNSFYSLVCAVFLQTGTAGVSVQSNVYTSCTTTINDAGTGNTLGGGSP